MQIICSQSQTDLGHGHVRGRVSLLPSTCKSVIIHKMQSILHTFVLFSLFLHSNSQGQDAQYQNVDFGFLDPNEAVYREIYQDAVNGELYVQQPQTQAQTPADTQLQTMYTQLFQQPLNVNRQGSAPTALDNCAKTVQIPAAEFASITSFAPRSQFFFSMNHAHLHGMQAVKKLVLEQPTAYDAICMARALRDRPEINRHAWLRGVVGATMDRPDMSHLARPSLAEIMPSLMINSPAIQQARRSAPTRDTCALVDGSVGKINGAENRLWYFREDLLINSNHWFWHLANPFSHVRLEVPVSPRPDRRGELFYYFHLGIQARYHSERLGNGLPPAVPLFLNPGTVLKEQYYAFLTDANSARNWTDRPANTRLQNLVSNRDFVNHPANISITDRLFYMKRIEDSIRNRALIDRTGRRVQLDGFSGIDLLSEVVEASIYSINPDYYSEFGVHNDGHFLIGLVADPDDTRQIPPSVMADGAVSMRDPLFYTYHVPIISLLDQHKRTLAPYAPEGGEWQLHWPDVEITSVRVLTEGQQKPNELTTHWNHVEVNLVRGLDFNRSDANGSAFACVQHLDHNDFSYEILVDNKAGGGGGGNGGFGNYGQYGFHGHRQRRGPGGATKATVRIFMAPRYDGRGQRYSMTDQRLYFFTMDHFSVELKPGPNVIKRRSTDSALTIPWPQTYEELERDSGRRLTPYCGCGWPQHMLLPKGNPKGQVFDLFVMITNGEEDAIPRSGTSGRAPTKSSCQPAFIYCGIAGQPYPDARPMNYPFDRLPYSVVDRRRGGSRVVANLDEYEFGISNMGTAEVVIRHNDNSASIKRQRPNAPPGFGFGHGTGFGQPGFGSSISSSSASASAGSGSGPINFGGGGFGPGSGFGGFGGFGSHDQTRGHGFGYGSYGR